MLQQSNQVHQWVKASLLKKTHWNQMKVIPEDEDVPCVPSKFFYSRLTFQSNKLYTNPGFRLPSLKNAWDLVYPRKNCDIREILRNLIGYLGDLELTKNDIS